MNESIDLPNKNESETTDELTSEDLIEFLRAKTFRERVNILIAHSQKNDEYVKRREKMKKEQESEKKKNFFKRAFKDMAENTRAQHEVDKANFAAAKAESRANFEENRGKNTLKRAKAQAKQSWDDAHMKPKERQAKIRAEQQQAISDAKERQAKAEARIEKAKQERK